jgi:hypothetical protein
MHCDAADLDSYEWEIMRRSAEPPLGAVADGGAGTPDEDFTGRMPPMR